jgi:hypothetical protein
MKKIITLLFLILGNISITNAQEHFELEASTGWNFYNRFNEADFYDKNYIGYGIQSGLDFWFSKKINKTFDARLGLGYANFYHLDFIVSDASHYASMRLGTDIQTFWKPMKFSTTLSSYLCLHKEPQDFFQFQRRFFTNLDLGLKFKMSDKLSLKINSPITLFPMFQDDNRSRINTGTGYSFLVDADVELTGANIGLIYKFGDREKNIVPSMQFSGVEGNLSVEASTGFLFYDLINQKKDVLNWNQNFGVQNSVDLWLSKQVNEKFDARIGVGYSNFYHINSNSFNPDSAQSSSYANFRLGTDIQSSWQPMKFSVAVSNYISLAKESEDVFNFQQRIFTNIDLGAKFKINDNLSIRATTPITLAPMLNGLSWGYLDENQEIVIVPKSRVGMTGVNLGLIYTFGKAD